MTTLIQRAPRAILLHQPRQYLAVRYASAATATTKPQLPAYPQSHTSSPTKPYYVSPKPSPPRLKPALPSKPTIQLKPPPSIKPVPPGPSPSTDKPLSKVNGPPTTLPPLLTTPTRTPEQSIFTYLYTLGKSYMTFYKTGGKNIWTNYKAAQPLEKRLNTGYKGSFTDAVAAGAFTRSDFQLIWRNRHDIKRVPVFGLVALCCGEFTPLVVVLFSNVVPWTCRIPKQIAKDRMTLESRRSISFRNLTLPPPEHAGVTGLERMQLIHISWSLGLSSSMWDWLGGQYPGLPTWILRRKVDRKVQYLTLDDKLIAKDGGVEEMVNEEVRMACVERGVNVVGRSDSQLRADLMGWLKSASKVPVEHLLLTRPSVWPAMEKKPETRKLIL